MKSQIQKLTDDEILKQVQMKENEYWDRAEKEDCDVAEIQLKEAIRLTREQCEKEQKDKIRNKYNEWAFDLKGKHTKEVQNLLNHIKSDFEKLLGDAQEIGRVKGGKS